MTMLTINKTAGAATLADVAEKFRDAIDTDETWEVLKPLIDAVEGYMFESDDTTRTILSQWMTVIHHGTEIKKPVLQHIIRVLRKMFLMPKNEQRHEIDFSPLGSGREVAFVASAIAKVQEALLESGIAIRYRFVSNERKICIFTDGLLKKVCA